jgi:hypothetical protein
MLSEMAGSGTFGAKARFETEIAEPKNFEPLIFNPTIN